MFRKYEKTFRLTNTIGKLSLSKQDIKHLFNGKVVIEEKMDGANIGIIRHKKGFSLQKRGSLVGPSEHAQFQFFHAWANHMNYDKLMALPEGFIFYGELLYAVHSIFYDKLIDWVMIFDIWNTKKEYFLDYDDRSEMCQKYNLVTVPLINYGYYDLADIEKMIPVESACGSMSEGVVVKRYSKKEYLKGKFVKPEFIKMIEDADDHWMHQIPRKNCLAQKAL